MCLWKGPLKNGTVLLISDSWSYPIARKKQDITLKCKQSYFFKREDIIETARAQTKPKEFASKVEGTNIDLELKTSVWSWLLLWLREKFAPEHSAVPGAKCSLGSAINASFIVKFPGAE